MVFTGNTPSTPSQVNQQRLGAAPPYNKSAWDLLPDVPITKSGIEAVLLEYEINGNEGKPAWQFLINPRSLQYRDAAEYTAISPHASRVAHRHYSGASSATLTIPDLVMYTYIYGKSIKPLIDGIRELLRAKPDQDIFSPPLLLLRLGSLRFGPCVLESVDWEEQAWLSGDPARVRMSMTLIEVPRPLTDAEKREQQRIREEREATQREAQDLPRVPLSDRQREEASNVAREYLNQNLDQWSDEVQSLVRSNGYLLETSADTGDVTMKTSDGQTIGTVLRSTGTDLLSSGEITTVPLAEGTTVANELQYETLETARQ